MSNGKGIAITGLIFGLVGLGLSGYLLFTTSLAPALGLKPPEREINNYYIEDDLYDISTSDSSYVDPMSVEFMISRPSSMYVLFNGYYLTGDVNTLRIFIYVNGESKTYPIRVTYEPDGVLNRIPFSAQYYNGSLIAGTYNVSIYINPDLASGSLYGITLYVQTITE